MNFRVITLCVIRFGPGQLVLCQIEVPEMPWMNIQFHNRSVNFTGGKLTLQPQYYSGTQIYGDVRKGIEKYICNERSSQLTKDHTFCWLWGRGRWGKGTPRYINSFLLRLVTQKYFYNHKNNVGAAYFSSKNIRK